MEVGQIIELMKAVSETGMTDFSYEENGAVLKLKKHAGKENFAVPPAAVRIQPEDNVPFGTVTAEDGEWSGNVVKSPLVGTFYSAGSPDADPYVKVGDPVSKGQVLGIIEAMKLMNEIESEYDGIVKEILVKNGDMVEYDQPMFVIG